MHLPPPPLKNTQVELCMQGTHASPLLCHVTFPLSLSNFVNEQLEGKGRVSYRIFLLRGEQLIVGNTVC